MGTANALRACFPKKAYTPTRGTPRLFAVAKNCPPFKRESFAHGFGKDL